jgi:preprotein translocase subunit SecA
MTCSHVIYYGCIQFSSLMHTLLPIDICCNQESLNMIRKLLASIFGTSTSRELKRLQPLVDNINAHEKFIEGLSDDELSRKTIYFREKLAQGASLEDILPESFAVVRETARRKIGQRHFDVQLIGGIVLHQGKIAEMKTGEGKTLTETLPLYLNALTGHSTHLVTPNDYLARRDAEWMSPIYHHLGLSVGVLQNNMNDIERKQAYQSDILYATNSELGFDYLRDNMKFRLTDYVQRDLSYAIVDEVDSILIDEARTPLIISGGTDESSDLYMRINRIIPSLKKDADYEVNEKDRTALLTESGNDKVEQALAIDNLYALENIKLLHHVNQALKAHTLFRRDVDYVVRDNEVLIVDEFTGRILSGRRYSDGLHQALEAKEHVTIERETQTLASITLQNYFRLYKKLAGMTGTAATEAEEFYQIYKLNVVSIPTHLPCIRSDKEDFIFLNQSAKYRAIVEDVKVRYEKGQPVLIGTVAVETSELLSSYLTQTGVPHEVLNAKNHAREAEIIAHAGEAKHITIATNMAGRGTDIKLTEESRLLGGLYVLGTERHESRRIDNQLRGRSGRQGDPGESRFYISLDDELIRIFAGGDNIKKRMAAFGMKEDEVIESSFVSRTIESAQQKVEKRNFETRKHLLEYDDVLNQQRMVIYRYRREILEESDNNTAGLLRDLIAATVEDLPALQTNKRILDEGTYNEIITAIANLTNIEIKDLTSQGISQTNTEQLRSDLINVLLIRYDLMMQGDHTSHIQDAHHWLMLETIDQAWKQHMLNLDRLKEGVGLRQMGQKNPLIEYKREAFDLFEDMMLAVRSEIVHNVFRLDVQKFNKAALEQEREHELHALQFNSAGQSSAQSAPAASTIQRTTVGRNDPCPCGSGLKYKKCHGK